MSAKILIFWPLILKCYLILDTVFQASHIPIPTHKDGMTQNLQGTGQPTGAYCHRGVSGKEGMPHSILSEGKDIWGLCSETLKSAQTEGHFS